MANRSQNFDVIVIGGGPAGSTAAAVLADHGRRALVLEREKFPRYRVGESLLPYCYFPLDRIGMIPQLKRSGFVKKHSVQFITIEGRVSQPFYFFQHLEHDASQTWQVLRSEFDRMLLDNARRKGTEVCEETTARQFITEGDTITGVEAESRNGRAHRFRAPVTIDCSGRDGFAINRLGWRVRDHDLNKIAIWTYYRGALRDPGLDEGATTIAYLPGKGWFWYIPLANDVVSVGITAEREYLYRRGRDPQEIFQREIKVNQWIEQHLSPAQCIEKFRVTSDYSYRTRYCATDGLVLAGDAFTFLDPVFSSGVFLALRSGEMAADAVEAALTAGDTAGSCFMSYGEQLCFGIEAMRKLIYGFYDEAFSFGKLLKKHPELTGDLTDCLIGNLFRNFDPLFKAVEQFARVPAPLKHGRMAERKATNNEIF